MEKRSNGELADWGLSLGSFNSLNATRRSEGWRLYGTEGGYTSCYGTYYIGFWRPSATSQLDYQGYEFGDAHSKILEMGASGWKLFLLDGFMNNGVQAFNFSLRKYNNDDWHVLGWYWEDFYDLFEDVYNDGWRIKTFTTYYVNGKLTVSASFTKSETHDQIHLYGVTQSEFEDIRFNLNLYNYSLTHMSVEGSYISAVFTAGAIRKKLIKRCAQSNIKSELEDAYADGYRTSIQSF